MKIGIALGGGGAKGYAHIGVLKVLKEHGIDCEIVAGTSIGALVGAVYAANRLEELEAQTRKFRITEIPMLLSPTWSTSGFFSGKNGLEFMMKLVEASTIEELPKTFGAVCVDLVEASPVRMASGNLRQALRASMSIPGLFTPVRTNGGVLVDGGRLDPLPVDFARELGADVVIAVDLFGDNRICKKPPVASEVFPREISSALNYFRSIPEKIFKMRGNGGNENGESKLSINLIEVIEHTLAITEHALTEANLRVYPPDLIIRPQVGTIGLLDFHRAELGIKLGEEAGRLAIPKLMHILGK